MKIRFFCAKKILNKNRLLIFSSKICQNLKVLKNQGKVCIVFVSDKKIQDLNQSFLKKNRPTDVIAFQYRAKDAGRRVYGDSPFGEIFVSVDTAKRQSKTGHYPIDCEIALLVMHGLLHLAGYQDYTADQRKKMFALQKKLFRKVNSSLAPPDFQ